MNEEIKKLTNKNDILNQDDLIKIAEIYLKEKNLKINEIYFTDKSPEYDFGTNNLGLSNNYDSDWLNQELNEFISNKYLKIVDNIDNINVNEILINNILIFLTMHEIRHAEQNKILSETFEKYDKTYVKYLLISLLKSTQFLRMLYHDKLYFEFDSNINAMLNFKDTDNIDVKRYLAYKFLVSYTNKNGTEYIDPITSNKNTFDDSISDLPNFDVTNYVKNCNDSIDKSFILGNKMDINELNNIAKIYKKGR